MIIPKYIVDQSIVNKEIRELNNVLNQQRQLKKNLLLYLEKISEGIYNSSYPQDTDKIHFFLEEVQKGFNRIKENMNKIIEQKNYLESISKTNNFEDLNFEIYNTKSTSLLEKINNDNNDYYAFMESLFDYISVTFPEINMDKKIDQKKISDIYTSQINALETIKEESKEKFVSESVIVEEEKENSIIEEVLKETENAEILDESVNESETMNKSSEEQPNIKDEPIIEKNVQEEKIYVESTIEIENSSFDKSNNKVLFISYKNNYAILPHTTEDLEKAFSDNPEKYSSLQDIIDKEYTISLKDYKIDSSSTVYDECFNIAKNKCNYNSLKAMKFANSAKRIEGANPLIIRACNNVNEVEFYLNCLENNKLDEFNLFKIEEEK